MVKAIKMVKDQRGLTLIELLAVIVILAIILAIAVPAIGNLINRTDDRATVSDAAQVIAAAKLHVATNGAPPTTGYSATNPNLTAAALEPYLDNAEWTNGATSGVWVSVDANNNVTYQVVGHDVSAILTTWASQATGRSATPTEVNIQAYLNSSRN